MVFVGLLGLFIWMPSSFRRWAGRLIGKLFYKLNKKRRKIAAINIELCFPELSKKERESMLLAHFICYGQSVVDLGFVVWGSKSKLCKSTEIIDKHHIIDALKKGERIIILTPHALAVDWCGIALTQFHGVTSMMKQFDNPFLKLANLAWQICQRRQYGHARRRAFTLG